MSKLTRAAVIDPTKEILRRAYLPNALLVSFLIFDQVKWLILLKDKVHGNNRMFFNRRVAKAKPREMKAAIENIQNHLG
tara:strand:- start:2996 stop:3232 length:237 start_codon:yes stop_codon:yes gene_type:complete